MIRTINIIIFLCLTTLDSNSQTILQDKKSTYRNTSNITKSYKNNKLNKSIEYFAQNNIEKIDCRVLLNYYFGGEMMSGAFLRNNFESYFTHVGYYNTISNLNEWLNYDVMITTITSSLSDLDIKTIKDYLSKGGGIFIAWSIFDQNSVQLRKIDSTLNYNNQIYSIGGGYVLPHTNFQGLAIGGQFIQPLFDNFLASVDSVGSKRVGDRSKDVKTYYGEDTTIVLSDIEFTCEKSRYLQYQTMDLPNILAGLNRLKNFTGINLNRRLKVVVRPMALEFWVFAFGATNGFDHIAASRVPGDFAGIFDHEVGHIFNHEFNNRYFTMPAFGEGVLGNISGDNNFGVAISNGKIIQKRSLYLWFALIDLVGVSNMNKFITSLDSHPKQFIPTDEYWNSIYSYPEENTGFFQQSINIINYYFSKAFTVNYTNQIRNWGCYEIQDWELVESVLLIADTLYKKKSIPDSISTHLYANMWKSFYKGLFGDSKILADSLYNYLVGIVSIGNQNLELPKQYILMQNYPNPFNPTTLIIYQIPISGLVNLRVYDALGREVAVLVNEEKLPGKYEVKFNGSNFSCGIYFYRLSIDNYSQTKKLILIK